MTYKEKENALYFFLDSKCSKLLAEGEKYHFEELAMFYISHFQP